MTVKTLKVGKKEIPFYFGTNALRLWCMETGKTIQYLQSKEFEKDPNNMDLSLQLIYNGIKDGFRKAKKEFKLTLDDISDFCDEDPEFLTNALQAIQKVDTEKK